ncbi:MAG TPA: hypothetical protein VLU24_00770 [Mycobacterium sp.]|nr:hypothetical protein [Mycobacterium sp.]
MTRGQILSVLLALGVGACVRPPAPVSPAVQRIAVLPPNNQTGDTLLIAAGPVLTGYTFTTDRITVPDVLAAEARTQLTRRGFTLVDPGLVDAATHNAVPSSPQDAANMATRAKLDGAVLYTVVRQWTPDNEFEPKAVIVAIDVSLVDPASGQNLWTASHPARPVQTADAINLREAYTRAARAVMEELLAPLTPAHTGP